MSSSFATPRTIAHQAPLSMGFPRQEHWSGLPFPSPGDLPDPGIEPVSPAWRAYSLPLSHRESPFLSVIYLETVVMFENQIQTRNTFVTSKFSDIGTCFFISYYFQNKLILLLVSGLVGQS